LHIAAASVVAACWIGVALASGGGLDPSFSGDGWVRTLQVRSSTDSYLPSGGEDVALQPDGKILVTGEIIDPTSHWYFGVFRYTADGSLDRSFAGGGFAEVDLGNAEFAHAVAIQRNGKIVVAGEADCPFAVCFALVRFLPDGRLDRSFGANGVVRTMFARYGASRAYGVAVQPDGKIIAVGMRFRGSDAQNDEVFAVARYLPDGKLDRTFSRDGLASVDFGYGDADASAVAVQRGGRILVAGSGARNAYRTEEDFAVARFRANGKLDRSFSGDGRVTVDFGHRLSDGVHGLALGRDGRIVLAGSSGKRGAVPRIAVARLLANGRLDRSFAGGKRLTRPGRHGGYARAVVQQPDGRIVVAGRVFDDGRFDTSAWALARYGRRGALDRSFGHGGLVVSDFSTGADWVGALAVQRDRRIVAAGSVGESQALARYRAG
jgi:uncharacterized delta-60 repeat protein